MLTRLCLALPMSLLALGCSGPGVVGGSDGAGGGATTVASTSASSAGQGGGVFTTSSSGTGGANCSPNGLDLDGCTCNAGDAPRPCYSGTPDHAGKGACNMGSQSCVQTQNGEVMTWAWAACAGSGLPSPEVCGDNVDNDCNGMVDENCQCMEGSMQSCIVGGEMGSQTCVKGMWTPCVTGGCQGAMAGQPCNMVGQSIAVPPNSCNCPAAGTPVTSIYCDDSMVWQCFPADDCSPPACVSCLQMNCSQFMTSPNPQCQTNLDTAVKWLEECGPDRNQWFTQLDAPCPNSEVSQLNNCKFQYCVMNGTCSFY